MRGPQPFRCLASVLVFALFLLTTSPTQTPDSATPVPIREEPHHHQTFENSYVRVFRFELPGRESALLHQHSLPYIAVSLTSGDIANAVVGKTEAQQLFADGQVVYSRGGFAHTVRNNTADPYVNLTIELLHPQGEPRNLCQKVVDGPLNNCAPGNVDSLPADSPLRALAAAIQRKGLFETDNVRLDLFSFALKQTYSEKDTSDARLLVVENGAGLKLDVEGSGSTTLTAGDVAWLAPGSKWVIATPGGEKPARFLMIEFKKQPTK